MSAMSVGSIRIRSPVEPGAGAHPLAADEARQRLAPVVVVVRPLLEVGEDVVGVLERPVREHDDHLAVEGVRLRPGRVDDERGVVAELLLERRVAVAPVGPELADRVAVLERRMRRDAGEVDVGHAVLVVGEDEPVPVDRRHLAQPVVDADHGLVALGEPEERAGNGAVHRHRRAGPAVERDRRPVDRQVVLDEAGAPDRRLEARLAERAGRQRRARPGRREGAQARERAGGGGVAEEESAVHRGGCCVSNAAAAGGCPATP